MIIFSQFLILIYFLGTICCNTNQCFTANKLHKVTQTITTQNYELSLNISAINGHVHQLYQGLQDFECQKLQGPFSSSVYKCNLSRKMCNNSFKLRDMSITFMKTNKLVIIPLEILIIENNYFSLVQQQLEQYDIQKLKHNFDVSLSDYIKNTVIKFDLLAIFNGTIYSQSQLNDIEYDRPILCPTNSYLQSIQHNIFKLYTNISGLFHIMKHFTAPNVKNQNSTRIKRNFIENLFFNTEDNIKKLQNNLNVLTRVSSKNSQN